MVEVAANDDIDSGLRAGSLEVRLARTAAEVDASQALRYRVFYEEMDAVPDADRARRRRDFDDFDAVCDHLLVVDHERGADGAPVPGLFAVGEAASLIFRADPTSHQPRDHDRERGSDDHQSAGDEQHADRIYEDTMDLFVSLAGKPLVGKTP
ncbi:MAG: GNAT family N-acetyltransferase [Proteobacteria bacterium]|nr:GNAT family N-acetyltransferase [Pseudomonadota bacterium]